MDIEINWDGVDYRTGDIVFENNDIRKDDGLKTAVLISLLTDARADEDDILPDLASVEKRGWHGEQLFDAADKWGSKLWQKERSTTIPLTFTDYETYSEEALQWMIDDGYASDVTATATRGGTVTNTSINLEVQITQPNGDVVTFKFRDLWEGTFNGV